MPHSFHFSIIIFFASRNCTVGVPYILDNEKNEERGLIYSRKVSMLFTPQHSPSAGELFTATGIMKIYQISLPVRHHIGHHSHKRSVSHGSISDVYRYAAKQAAHGQPLPCGESILPFCLTIYDRSAKIKPVPQGIGRCQ